MEWLGDVPEHWEVAALRRVVASIRASNVDKHVRGNEITVKLCNYVDVYHNDRIDSQIDFMTGSATAGQIEHFQLQVGDVLITKDSEVATDIGVPSLVVERVPDLVAGYHLTLIRPNAQRLVGSYLFRALQSDVASLQFTHGAQGVTRYGLTYASIKSVRLPVPPPHEQHAIASYLDRETAKINALIRRQEALVKRLEEHRTALVSRTMTRGLPPAEARKAGLDPHPKLKPSGVEWLGEMPEHWEVRRLKFVARRSIKNGLGEAAIHDDPDWPRYIRITDIASSRKLHGGTFKSLPPALAAKATVEAHDILFAAVGATYGKSYYHASQKAPVACFAGYLVRFSPDVDQVAPAFVAYWAESHAYWALIRSRVVQATIENFSAFKYKNLCVPVPPPHEQHAIASYLDRETTKIDRVAEFARQEIHLLREYRTRLISDVVTGKVDVRGIAGTDMETAA